MENPLTLEDIINEIMKKSSRDSGRLGHLADYAIEQLYNYGLPGVKGGSVGELKIAGIGRPKNWDVAYTFAEKPRLLISQKSIWSNPSGSIPNRIDEVMGEASNVQQMAPEVVTGYMLLFDISCDTKRKDDGTMWSDFFEASINKLTLRKSPLWNYGLLEGTLFIKIDSREPYGSRVIDSQGVETKAKTFFVSLLRELITREPAIKLTKPLPT